AAGFGDVALATDTVGSVRLPAAWCGVVGFKTSQGLLPSSGLVPLARELDTIGFHTRSAREANLLLDALSPRPVRHVRPDDRPLSIGVVTSLCSASAPPVADAVRRTADTLMRLGATLRAIELPDSREAELAL